MNWNLGVNKVARFFVISVKKKRWWKNRTRNKVMWELPLRDARLQQFFLILSKVVLNIIDCQKPNLTTIAVLFDMNMTLQTISSYPQKLKIMNRNIDKQQKNIITNNIERHGTMDFKKTKTLKHLLNKTLSFLSNSN